MSTIKKLMINIPGPAVTAARAAGPSGAAQLAAFMEEQKQGGKIVLEKLNHIENEINKNTLTVKKLVEMGGIVKQVREQLAGKNSIVCFVCFICF
jgi:hypothetical protein